MLPAGHERHDTCPGLDVKEPALQSTHVVDPGKAWKRPAGQAGQEELRPGAAEAVPAAHNTHNCCPGKF